MKIHGQISICRWAGRLLASSLLIGMSAAAHGQSSGLKDPTIPPPAWLALNPLPPLAGVEKSMADGTGARVPVVIVSKSRNLAVINGKVAEPGDLLSGSKISEIRRDKVMMVEEEKSLAVTPNVVKQSPVRQETSRKRVVIPEETLSSSQTGSKQ